MKAKLFLIQLLIFLTGVTCYAADNMIYLKKGSYNSTLGVYYYNIGLMNGATMTSPSDAYLANLPILADAKGEPFIRKGDFNGDGRDDILVVIKTSNASTPYTFRIYDISSYSTQPIASFDRSLEPLFITIGKFDSSELEKDIINIISFEEMIIDDDEITGITPPDDYLLTTIKLSSQNAVITLIDRVAIVNKNSDGNIVFVNKGDFDGNGTDELNVIYRNLNSQKYKNYNALSPQQAVYGPAILVTNGTIIFTCVGRFSGSNKDELTYVYDHTDGVHQTYRTIDLTNNLQISPTITSTYSTDLTNLLTMGRIIYVTKGDYNGDGKDELTYVFNHVNGVHQTYKTLNVITYAQMSPTSGSTDLTNKGNMGELKVFTSGDYNGDGKDDLGYIYGMAGSSSSVIVRLDPINYTSVSKSFPASPSTLAGGLVLGPVAKYMSYPDDNYTPLKDPSTTGNYFPIGWYSNGGSASLNVFDTTNSNTYLPMLGGVVWDMTNPIMPPDIDDANAPYPITNVHELSIANNQRRVIFDLLGTVPWTASTVSLDFQNAFLNELPYPKLLNTTKYFQQPLLGFYIGDDSYYFYFAENKTYYIERMKKLNSKIFQYYPSYYTFAAETGSRFISSYDAHYKTLKNFIPMEFEYYYISIADPSDLPTTPDDFVLELKRYLNVPNYINYKMIEQNIKNYKLKILTKTNSQPGYIYIAQAHDNLISQGKKWYNRNATYKESRYEIYNAIINGANGVIFWDLTKSDTAYIYSNEINVANLSKITDEITNTTSIFKNNGYIPLDGSLLKSLMETPGDFKVYCSKDGYNSDFDDNFDVGTLNQTKVEIPFIGRAVADINYVIRGDNNTGVVYLIVVNNSNNPVSDIKFYIPGASISVYDVANKNAAGGANTYTSMPFEGSVYKRDLSYKTFKTSMAAYDVKIFKITCPGSPSPDFMEGSAQEKASGAEVTDFALSQNYPNPFNPSTVISYDIPQASRVTLKVYDILGREVADLVNEFKEAGRYNVKFDASHLSTGIYIYQLRANDYVSIKKMSFVK